MMYAILHLMKRMEMTRFSHLRPYDASYRGLELSRNFGRCGGEVVVVIIIMIPHIRTKNVLCGAKVMGPGLGAFDLIILFICDL